MFHRRKVCFTNESLVLKSQYTEIKTCIKSTIKALIVFCSTSRMTCSKLIQILPAPALVNLTPKTTNRNREARAGQYTWWFIVAESLKLKNQIAPLYIPSQVKDSKIKRTQRPEPWRHIFNQMARVCKNARKQRATPKEFQKKQRNCSLWSERCEITKTKTIC